MLNVLSIRHSCFGVNLALGMGPAPRPLTQASVASRSQRARRRGERGAARAPISARLISSHWDCNLFFFLLFLLRQESETTDSRKETVVACASSTNPWTIFDQSAAQQEPHAPCAQNSNRCQSPGLGPRARIRKDESEHKQ